MNALRLRFPDPSRDGLVLGTGVHAIGGGPGGPRLVSRSEEARLQFCVDERGTWLQLREGVGAARVHVNGRPVRRMALLRAGDSVHIDGLELTLEGPPPEVPEQVEREHAGNSRYALRGIGGAHHGRCFPIDRERSLGSAADSDIPLDEPGVADRHARLLPCRGGVLLEAVDPGAACRVNGHAVEQALLEAGDQIVLGQGQRFVVEAPLARRAAAQAPEAATAGDDAEAAGTAQPRAASLRHLPWVLLAAVLIAGLLALLLLYSPA